MYLNVNFVENQNIYHIYIEISYHIENEKKFPSSNKTYTKHEIQGENKNKELYNDKLFEIKIKIE